MDKDTNLHYKQERDIKIKRRRDERKNEVEVAAQVPGQKAKPHEASIANKDSAIITIIARSLNQITLE